MKYRYKILFAVCLFTGEVMFGQESISAFQYKNKINCPVGQENSREILSAKAAMSDAGSMVYLYVKNSESDPIKVKNINWNGFDFSTWSSAQHNYQAIWYTSRPETIQPGEVCEIAVCLRSALVKDSAFEVEFSNGKVQPYKVNVANPPYKAGTIAFSRNLSKAWIYFVADSNSSPLPQTISCNGRDITTRWLSDKWVNKLRIAEVIPNSTWQPGERVVFTVKGQNNSAYGASLRAFSNLSTFGTYGTGDLQRYAENGLDSYSSFIKVNRYELDKAANLNMRIVSGSYEIEDFAVIGHPNLYAYLLLDEPDAHDWGKGIERPVGYRLGTLGMEMVRRYNTVIQKDARTPALLTIDLTFTPLNYFVYAPLADISNPDIYTNTCGWNPKVIDHHLSMVKDASGPRPFAYTYQSCWEEWSTYTDKWAGKREILADGFDKYRNTAKSPRGLGFNTNPDEIAIAMHYGIGNGAVALFAYTDSTEACNGLLNHGSDILPENWAAVGSNSRVFRNIQSLLLPAHPTDLAIASSKKIWVKTLLSGNDALLVVAVNENYKCDKKGFFITPTVSDFHLSELPWLVPQTVCRVTENGFEPVESRREGKIITWSANVRNGAVFLIVPSDAVLERINTEAIAERASITDGLKLNKRMENTTRGCFTTR